MLIEGPNMVGVHIIFFVSIGQHKCIDPCLKVESVNSTSVFASIFHFDHLDKTRG